MRTGKLNISRGSSFADKPVEAPVLSLVSGSSSGPCANPSIEPPREWLRERLEMLERLGRLHALGLLSNEEFGAEKALLLAQSERQAGFAPRPSSSSTTTARKTSEDASLLGRLFNWKFLPIGLIAGLALSFGAQPQETLRFLDQALKFAGA
jgi:hypothetical protein